MKEKSGVWLDSFVGNWNKDWKVGSVVEVSKEQLKSREYQGKTYWTIAAPPEAKGFQVPSWIPAAITDLQNRVAELEHRLQSEIAPVEDEEMPEIGEEESGVNMDDIPF